MHKTLTDVEEEFISLTRQVARTVGIDLTPFSDDEILTALESFDDWFTCFQIENDVDIHYGNEIEHWTEANRVMFEAIGITGLSDDILISVEKKWRERLKTWEMLRPEAKSTIYELHKRGYPLGVCTRRPDDPSYLLREWGILDKFSTVRWTSVPGYAKPYPYTLILAADDLGVNPQNCAFVGNSVDVDVVAAQRAGMTPVLATWAYTEEVVETPEGTYIINKVSELLDLLIEL